MQDKLKNSNKTNVTTDIWVYKKLNGQYYLLDYNQPFKSILQRSKLKIIRLLIKSLTLILVIMNYISLVKSYKK